MVYFNKIIEKEIPLRVTIRILFNKLHTNYHINGHRLYVYVPCKWPTGSTTLQRHWQIPVGDTRVTNLRLKVHGIHHHFPNICFEFRDKNIT